MDIGGPEHRQHEAIAGRIGAVQSDGSVVWGAEFRVNVQAAGGQFEQQVVELGGGRVLFTWLSNDIDVDGDPSGISARIGTVQPDGSIVWDSFGELTVNEEVQDDQEGPLVTTLADGRVMFAWTSYDPDVDGSGSAMSARIGTVQPDGSVVWGAAGEITLNEEITNGQFGVQISVLPDGRVLATWWSEDPDVDGASAGISTRIGTVLADGSISWGAAGELTVNEEVQGVQNEVQVTVLPDGRVLFVWSSSDPDVDGSFSGVSARIGTVASDGSISWAAAGEFTVNQETEGGQIHPQVMVLSDGRLLFTWTTFDTTIDASGPGISARIGALQADGSIVWDAAGEIRINAAGIDAQQYPQVTELDDGRIVFTWQSADPAADGIGTGIVGRTLQFNQAPVANDDAVAVAENGLLSGGNVLADNGAGADDAVDGDTLTVSAVNGAGGNVGVQIALASGALLTVNADGTFAYDPNGQFEHLGVGESANDTFYGGDGNDVLNGGDGNDLIDGLNHNDTAHGGAGDDEMYGRQNDDALSGDAGRDSLFGGDGADTLSGGDDDDQLDGGNQNDNLAGGGGADTLDGGNGADRLDGGLGADTLIGGPGADTFVFSSALGGGNIDSIAVFNLADDLIELDVAIFTGLGLGALDANAFVIGAAATTAEHRIIYDAVTGALYYDADGDGAGEAVQFATLAPGLLGLTHENFVGGGGP